MKEKEILNIIYDSLDDLNQMNPDNKLDKKQDTQLYGKNGKLDSLGLVNLILSIEDKLYEKTTSKISLADDKAFSESSSPFHDIKSLVNFIDKKINDL